MKRKLILGGIVLGTVLLSVVATIGTQYILGKTGSQKEATAVSVDSIDQASTPEGVSPIAQDEPTKPSLKKAVTAFFKAKSTETEEEAASTPDTSNVSEFEVQDSANVQVEASAPQLFFKVTRLTQTIFPETKDYYAYGGYEITVTVTASGGDVYIPMTTSDSTAGLTGFSYGIYGDAFRGKQNSRVSCSRKSDNLCKILDGQTSDVTVTVWLTPSQSGNYSIRFNNLKASIANGDYVTYSLNRETEAIYISY